MGGASGSGPTGNEFISRSLLSSREKKEKPVELELELEKITIRLYDSLILIAADLVQFKISFSMKTKSLVFDCELS